MPGGVVPAFGETNVIQPGEWVSIYGLNLASETATWNNDFPTSLAGTSVTIGGKPAYLAFVSPSQIRLQAPDDTAVGQASVVVTTPTDITTSTADSPVTLAPSFSLLYKRFVTGELFSGRTVQEHPVKGLTIFLVRPAIPLALARWPRRPAIAWNCSDSGSARRTPPSPRDKPSQVARRSATIATFTSMTSPSRRVSSGLRAPASIRLTSSFRPAWAREQSPFGFRWVACKPKRMCCFRWKVFRL